MAGVAMSPLTSETVAAFRTAQELCSKDPAQRRRTIEELEARIAAQDDLIERYARRITELEESPAQKSSTRLREDERLQLLEKLVEIRKDGAEQLRAIKDIFENELAKRDEIIDKLTRERSDLEKEIYDVKELAKTAIGKLREDMIVDKGNVNDLKTIIDNLSEENNQRKQEICDVNESIKTEFNGRIAAQKLDKEYVDEINRDLDAALDKINEHADLINKLSSSVKRTPAIPKGEKTVKRIEMMVEILKSGPRTFGEIERLLNITPKEMSRLTSKLDMRCFKITSRPGDERQKIIRLKAWSGNCFPSNVKGFSEESKKKP